MAIIEFNGENCLKLLRKQFPGEWQGLLKKARRMVTAQRRRMKGAVSVQQAAAACIMQNGPALSIMAASWVMAHQEQLLQEHIELDLEMSQLQEKLDEMSGERLERIERKRKLFYESRMTKKRGRIGDILKEITDWSRTMGDVPHSLSAGGYCPPRWESGKGFLNA